ncbi:uncharacterized protein LOC144166166 isoform X1 [Haemaphysalis longicornis]
MSGTVFSDMCDVYLCNTPVQRAESFNLASSVLSYFASSGSCASGDSWNKHWLLVFDYGDDEVLICDADMDSAGDLTGRKYWKKRAAFEKCYPNRLARQPSVADKRSTWWRKFRGEKRYLGRHRVPDKLLEKLLKKMCDSGQYHLMSNNCQTWALDLLRELGIKPPEEEHHAGKVVKGVIIPAAVVIGGALLAGAGLLGALILGNTRRNNRDYACGKKETDD